MIRNRNVLDNAELTVGSALTATTFNVSGTLRGVVHGSVQVPQEGKVLARGASVYISGDFALIMPKSGLLDVS